MVKFMLCIFYHNLKKTPLPPKKTNEKNPCMLRQQILRTDFDVHFSTPKNLGDLHPKCNGPCHGLSLCACCSFCLKCLSHIALENIS